MSTSKKAGPAKAIAKANEAALVGFNGSQLTEAMLAMSEKRQAVDHLTGEMQDAAVMVCRIAETTATESAAVGMDGDSIAQGWLAEVKARYPALAKAGCTFVKPSDKKDGEFILSGYGQNVNSTARGFCQYPGELTVDGCADEDGNVTISGIMAAVRDRRAQDESDEVKAVKAAKADLADAIKLYRSTACKGNSAERIAEFTAALIEAVASYEASDAELEALEAETEAVAA